jgi:serine/threonine protein kinase
MAGLEGKILGECKIIKRLGEGGMGQVFLAEQVRIGRQVAVKVLRPPRPASDDGPAPLADAPDRFKLEARAVAALQHPNILAIYDFGISEGLMYIVMPLMPDGSLLEAIRPGSSKRRFYLPMSPADAAPLIFQAASALQYAHDHNVIHRDVKPENFLVRPQPDGSIQLFLADFGLAKLYNPSSGSATLAVGTADYVAPEQIEGHPVPASDQYALAVMTYELLVGRLPFTGGVGEVALKHLRTPPPTPRSINPQVPAKIEEVILRAMSKRAQDRWPSILEYAHAYNNALKSLEEERRQRRHIEEETRPSGHRSQGINEETRIIPPKTPTPPARAPQPRQQDDHKTPQRGPQNLGGSPAPAAVKEAPTIVAPPAARAQPSARPPRPQGHVPTPAPAPRPAQPPPTGQGTPSQPADEMKSGLGKWLIIGVTVAAVLFMVLVLAIFLSNR